MKECEEGGGEEEFFIYALENVLYPKKLRLFENHGWRTFYKMLLCIKNIQHISTFLVSLLFSHLKINFFTFSNKKKFRMVNL